VSPPTGPKGTTFTYRVVYKDAAGNEPTARALEIRRNGTPWASKTMQPGTTGINSFRYGKLYLQTVVIDQPGRYKYRFTFVDGSGKATGTATTWTAGPTITAPGSALVTAAAAAPFGRGAQVTFTLPDAAGVTATVLNVAGRPVKTIAADRPLEAGLQTLTWDGTAEGGLAVPAGLYLIHVTARGEDGSQSSAVAAARLR